MQCFNPLVLVLAQEPNARNDVTELVRDMGWYRRHRDTTDGISMFVITIWSAKSTKSLQESNITFGQPNGVGEAVLTFSRMCQCRRILFKHLDELELRIWRRVPWRNRINRYITPPSPTKDCPTSSSGDQRRMPCASAVRFYIALRLNRFELSQSTLDRWRKVRHNHNSIVHVGDSWTHLYSVTWFSYSLYTKMRKTNSGEYKPHTGP